MNFHIVWGSLLPQDGSVWGYQQKKSLKSQISANDDLLILPAAAAELLSLLLSLQQLSGTFFVLRLKVQKTSVCLSLLKPGVQRFHRLQHVGPLKDLSAVVKPGSSAAAWSSDTAANKSFSLKQHQDNSETSYIRLLSNRIQSGSETGLKRIRFRKNGKKQTDGRRFNSLSGQSGTSYWIYFSY